MLKLDLGEFVEFGYLQEVNRTFLHPLGLALAVSHQFPCLILQVFLQKTAACLYPTYR